MYGVFLIHIYDFGQVVRVSCKHLHNFVSGLFSLAAPPSTILCVCVCVCVCVWVWVCVSPSVNGQGPLRTESQFSFPDCTAGRKPLCQATFLFCFVFPVAGHWPLRRVKPLCQATVCDKFFFLPPTMESLCLESVGPEAS